MIDVDNSNSDPGMNKKIENVDIELPPFIDAQRFTLVITNNKANNLGDSKCCNVLGFLFTGMACFIPINYILNSYDTFFEYFKGKSDVLFINLFFISTVITHTLIIISSPKFSFYTLMQISLITSILAIISIPIILIYLTENSFVFTCIPIFMMGISSTTFTVCLYSLIMHIDKVFTYSVVLGHGFAAIILTLSKFIIHFVCADKMPISLITFSCIASCLMIITIIIWFKLIKQLEIRKSLKRLHPTLALFDEEVDNEERCLSLCSYKSGANLSINIDLNTNISEYQKIIQVLKLQTSMNIMIIFHGFITYFIFPCVIFKFLLFSNEITISLIFIMALFNIFDFFGRNIPVIFHFKNNSRLYCFIVVRFLFIILFIFVHYMRHEEENYRPVIDDRKHIYIKTQQYPILYSDYSISVYIAFFAFSNGLVNGNSLALINSGKLYDDLKRKASSVLNLSLNIGGLFGTSIAYLIIILMF